MYKILVEKSEARGQIQIFVCRKEYNIKNYLK
jgi:hypothetical protein